MSNLRALQSLFHAFLGCVAFLLADRPSVAQVVVFHFATNDWRGDSFRSMGVDAAGQVWMVGTYYHDGAGRKESLIHFNGQDFEIVQLGLWTPGSPHGQEMDYFAEARRISRDGQYTIGTLWNEEGRHETIWTRDCPGCPTILTNPVPGCSFNAYGVASTPHGPLITGELWNGTFFWNQRDGFSTWMTNNGFSPITYAINADGKRWAGEHGASMSTQYVLRPFLGSASKIEILDVPDHNGTAFLISPNGDFIAGIAYTGAGGVRGMVWTKKTSRVLSFGTNAFVRPYAVTDTGFVGGTAFPGVGVIYDPNEDEVELFDQWWSRHNPGVALPASVVSVVDLQEYDKKLYCLIELNDPETEFSTTALAVMPLQRRNPGSFVKPSK